MFRQPIPQRLLEPDGHRLYERAVEQIRTALATGKTYEEACSNLDLVDQELKEYIVNDFLKILIAEEHLGSGVRLEDLALYLGLSFESLERAVLGLWEEILEEISAGTGPDSGNVSLATH